MISIVACDPENLGVITDYEVVRHLAQLTHKVSTSAVSITLYRNNSMSVRRLSIRSTGDNNRNYSSKIGWNFILLFYLSLASQFRKLPMAVKLLLLTLSFVL